MKPTFMKCLSRNDSPFKRIFFHLFQDAKQGRSVKVASPVVIVAIMHFVTFKPGPALREHAVTSLRAQIPTVQTCTTVQRPIRVKQAGMTMTV